MKVSFFVEFPEDDFKGLKYVNFPTKLYIAAKSIKEFNLLKKKFKNKNISEFVYWPILDHKEGYWISLLSKNSSLKRIFSEIKDTPTMVDLELPTKHNPFLFFTQLINIFKNKKMIVDFIDNNKNVYTAEYYPQGKFMTYIFKLLGLHFDPNRWGNKSIKMLYHSLHNFDEKFIIDELSEGVKNAGKNYLVAYGLLSGGVNGGSVMTQKQLKIDLELAKRAGISEVIIFRLGGLNKSHTKLITGYLI